jgi:hypothetical protein
MHEAIAREKTTERALNKQNLAAQEGIATWPCEPGRDFESKAMRVNEQRFTNGSVHRA